MTIIHPCDENPLSEKNKLQRNQYLRGGVNLSGESSVWDWYLEW